MPNEQIDVGNLEALEKYRSFTRYFRQAEKEGRKARWWKTYRQYASPEPGTRGKGSSEGESQGRCLFLGPWWVGPKSRSVKM